MDNNKNIKVSIIITYSHKNILFFVIVVRVKHGVLDLRQGEVPHLVEAAGECGLVLSGAPHLTLHTQITHNYFLKLSIFSTLSSASPQHSAARLPGTQTVFCCEKPLFQPWQLPSSPWTPSPPRPCTRCPVRRCSCRLLPPPALTWSPWPPPPCWAAPCPPAGSCSPSRASGRCAATASRSP